MVVGFLAARITWLTTFVFGLALGAIVMFFLRSIIISAAPTVLVGAAINYYWLATLIVACITATLSVFCVSSDGRKSLVILASSSLAGGYGLATAINGLINLYVGSGSARRAASRAIATSCE